MATRIAAPTIIAPAGNKPKQIAEYVGRVNSSTSALSVAHMKSPDGWVEPGQTPEFDEYTLVLKGSLRVETASRHIGHSGRSGSHRPEGRMGPL